VGEDLVSEVPVARLLADQGFRSKRWEEVLQERRTTLLTTPDPEQHRLDARFRRLAVGCTKVV
jgi:hypothetical protein